MPDQSLVLEHVRTHWEYLGKDVDRAHEIFEEDAVLEFPQSGERFEGVANFREWRRQYPADVEFRIRRMTVREDLAVVECSISYQGGPWRYGVQLLEFRGEKVARERVYVMEGWDAPDWRAPWRADTPADPTDPHT
jgi:SnoaL-like domain